MTAVAAGAVLALAACGGTAGGAGSNHAADGTLEATELAVGVLPLADYAAVYWADQKGLFEKEGLQVELQPLQGGPIGIQSTISGDVDCSFANTISTTITQSTGAPVKIVALSSGLGPESNVFVVQSDSPIRSIQDLDGKTVGVNTTRNIGDVTFRSLTEATGATVEPTFVEVPFNEMIAGVQAGAIDVGYTPEPFASAALAAGLRPVVDLTQDPNAGLAAAAFVCSNQFIGQNPDTTAAFARALYAAGADISQKEAEFRTWLPGVAGVPEQVAETMKLPQFFSEPKPDELNRVVELLERQGLMQGAYDRQASFYQP